MAEVTEKIGALPGATYPTIKDANDATKVIDHVANTRTSRLQLQNQAHSDASTSLTGATTNATYRRIWEVEDDAKHAYVRGATCTVTLTSGNGIALGEDYQEVRGWVVNGNGVGSACFRMANASGSTGGLMEACVLYGANNSGVRNWSGTHSNWTFRQCTAYGMIYGFRLSFVGGTGLKAERCEAYNGSAGGFDVAPNCLYTGCRSFNPGASVGDFLTHDAASDYNISSDATVPDNGNSIPNATPADEAADVTPGSEDPHLIEDAQSIDAGVAIAGISETWEGVSIPQGAAPDLGVDEWEPTALALDPVEFDTPMADLVEFDSPMADVVEFDTPMADVVEFETPME